MCRSSAYTSAGLSPICCENRVRKGGDAAVLRKNNTKATAGQEASFESLVGKKPGEAQGTVSPGDPSGVLKQP